MMLQFFSAKLFALVGLHSVVSHDKIASLSAIVAGCGVH
jgi:hypothetical protein